ncbi:alpha-glucosidase [Aquimarina sp. AD1]|uniref:glycoside hydrolase family 13 protein n=1 Tax=Aquimarina sp. (strain AD1) TaxID=1714848 RepID=UPI000E46FC80|nr:alpha-glucosidase [Aquimarina sp. AD1]AXT56847.1 alpha-glucosidase [Aquimarina sp. AD1]RKN11652.1 alpha,alpha-phosphotrehalase [Aquimarina sp. AD1]
MKLTWFRKGTIYQIYPRSFNDSDNDGVGDLKGIIEKLDYIKSLYVDIIWLSPIFSSPNDDNGYDISDYCSIMPEFGTMEDFDELLKETHKRGMRLILDLVANHCSDEHNWFEEAKKSKNSPYRDYFHWRKPGPDGGVPNNWKSFFGGSAWELDEASGEYYLHLFTKKQPDLNWENPKVREEIYNAMRFWLDKGVDGFRMDVIPLISKPLGYPDAPDFGFRKIIEEVYANGPTVHKYLKEMNEEVISKYDAFSLAEGVGIDDSKAGLYVNEDRNELDMLYHFDILECTIVNGKFEEVSPFNLIQMKEIFKKWRDAVHRTGWIANAMGNHDFARMVSRFGDDNKYHSESAKMLITMLSTQNGTLNIYQGDEIGMTNISLNNIDQVRDVQSLNFYSENQLTKRYSEDLALQMINKEGRDNARTPIQWNDEINGGFSLNEPWLKSNPNYKNINVKNQNHDSTSILNFYRNLLKTRREHDVFVFGDFEEIEFDNPNLYIYKKTLGEDKIMVLLNFSSSEESYYYGSRSSIANGSKVLINNYDDLLLDDKSIVLKPYQGVILDL